MKSLKNLSIKQKLIAIIVFTTMVASLISFSILFFIDYTMMKRDFVDNGVLQARLIGQYVEVALSFNDTLWATHVMDKVSAVPNILEGHIYDKNNHIFADYEAEGVLHQQYALMMGGSGVFYGGYLIILEPVYDQKDIIGHVLLKISTRQLQEHQVTYAMIIILITFLVLILTFFIGNYLQGIISKPIVALAKATRDISAEFEYRLSVSTDNNDEIGTLYTEFETMLAKIGKRDEELKKTRSYLSNVIDSMPSILIGIEPNGIISRINRAAEEALHIRKESVEGTMITSLLPQFSDYLEDIKSTIHKREPILKSKINTFIDGTSKIVDLTAYPLVANGISGAVIRIDDVTERVQLENMMIQTEKMISVGGLAAGMAHEINNPLGIITNGTQNILQKIKPDLKANLRAAEAVGVTMEQLQDYFTRRSIVEFVQDIREAAKRASTIVANMLAFSRKSDSSLKETNMATLIDNTINLISNDYDLKKRYDFKSIAIIKKYPPEIPEVSICETEIEQVFINLLKNGAQAMDEVKDREHQFTISIESDEKWLFIKVSDNGPGIPEDIRNRIFEPFFTTKAVGVGTGLGLSVSYTIITNRHKGEMSVESHLGEGTTFLIKLPLKRREYD